MTSGMGCFVGISRGKSQAIERAKSRAIAEVGKNVVPGYRRRKRLTKRQVKAMRKLAKELASAPSISEAKRALAGR